MVFPAASRPTVRGNNKEAKKSHFENDGVFSQLNVCKVGSQNVMRDPKIENAHKMEASKRTKAHTASGHGNLDIQRHEEDTDAYKLFNG